VVAAATVALLTLAFGASIASAPALAPSYLALLLLPIVLAGLLLGRLSLIAVTAAVAVVGELGLSNVARAGDPAAAGMAGNFLYAALLIAAVVDQFGGTLRGALDRSIAHQRELESAEDELRGQTGQLQSALESLEKQIAERERLENERIAMEARVLEVQKLESLGVLAGGIAHDFNNLLVGVLGNAGLALLELPPESPARQRIVQIETAARRAADLAHEMLAYSGKGKFIVTALDLSELVREMTHLLSVSIGKSVAVRYALSPEPEIVEGDATQLRQVVMNLVVNASDAIGENNGVITVATGHVHADRGYLSTTFIDEGLTDGNYAFLEVSDTGSGMDPATQARIFDPFFTTKVTGRGLGLAAVLGIVRGHAGALKVYSEPGRGTTFKLLLPRTDGAVSATAPRPAIVGWRATGRVLVVDDEELVRNVAAAMMSRLGFEVDAVVDGQSAIDAVAADPARYTAVLLDLTMPGLSGADTFSRLRSIVPELPVVLMSGYSEEAAGARFAGKGVAGFLEKPFSPDEVARAMRQIAEADRTAAPTSGG
jgi:signal transduction histidine kinase/CheY-like chemotaxis protein